jgi:DNA-binding phage protein
MPAMTPSAAANIPAALHNALKTHKALLRSINHWGNLTGLGRTTVREAFKPDANPTVDTLTKLAAAANMTLAELLDYGTPDWQIRVRARQLLSRWPASDVLKLAELLDRRFPLDPEDDAGAGANDR